MSVPSPDPRSRPLESRLEDGYRRIEQAKQRGEDITAWEDFWIELLREYEVAEDAAGRGRS